MQNGDIESVLFLLTVRVNVNNRVQDATQVTPLHLCVQNGNEIILRNLVIVLPSFFERRFYAASTIQLLAGANINDVTANRRSALHIAAENNRGSICSILLENQIHANLVDSNQNTGMPSSRVKSIIYLLSVALHVAVQHGHYDVVRRLLSESDIDVLTINMK